MRRFFVVFVLISALVAPIPASLAQRKSGKAAASSSAAVAASSSRSMNATPQQDISSRD